MGLLLERDGELAALRTIVAGAAQRRGAVVLITGEAGIGKSSLVSAWLDDPGAEDTRALVGWCDDFLTSRPLGPLHDVARTAGGAVREAVLSGDTGAVLEALLAELAYPLGPTLLILEDMHWADEATLDVVRYVGRRVQPLPAVLALTFRDDEVGPDHPLTGVLGALPTTAIQRIMLRPLSRSAVAELTADSGLRPDEVMSVTGGNPFFVTELAAAGTSIPASVGDAVLARVRKLPEPAQRALEALAVVPGPVDRYLAEALVPQLSDLADAERRGVLVTQGGALRFRHELARRAVLVATPDLVRTAHHRRVLDHLLAIGAEPASVLHHAAGAGRADVIATHGPVAATQAFRSGSHREAVAHHARVLAHPDLLAPEVLAGVLQEHAWALLNLLRVAGAVDAAARAVELRARLPDRPALVRARLTFARMLYMAARPHDAAAQIDAAQRALPSGGDEALEAEVCTQRLALAHLTDRHDLVLAEWKSTRTLARRLGRSDLEIYSALYGGTSRVMLGDVGGLAAIDDAIRLGRERGHLEPVARAYTNLMLALVLLRRWDEAAARGEEAMRFYDDHEFTGHRYDTVSQLVQALVQRGDWRAAWAWVAELREYAGRAGALRSLALAAEAMLVVRAGSPEAETILEGAWQVAAVSRSESVVPAACAGIEWAWLAGRPDAAAPFVEAALQKAAGTVWLARVRWRLPLIGRPADPEGVDTEPERTSLAGDWRAAAAGWAALGMPFERGVELLRSGEADASLEALGAFEALGAEPAARLARQRLRDLGVRHIPRGPRAATRDNRFGLTTRQAEVLELVAEGLTNAEIADRLVVSVRTVDHHVAAVLDKLGVSSRQQAAERAQTAASDKGMPADGARRGQPGAAT